MKFQTVYTYLLAALRKDFKSNKTKLNVHNEIKTVGLENWFYVLRFGAF